LLLFAQAAFAADPVFTLHILRNEFKPAELKIPADVKVQLVVDNQDDLPNEFDSYNLHREKHVPAHSTATLYIGPLKPGRYPFLGEEKGALTPARGVLVVE
jgi:hypothetical protein